MSRDGGPVDDLPYGRILTGDCISTMERLDAGSVDLIFADPPYEIVIRRKMLEALAKVINPGGALVIEQSRRQTAEPGCSDLEMVYNRDYGDSKLIIYNKAI